MTYRCNDRSEPLRGFVLGPAEIEWIPSPDRLAGDLVISFTDARDHAFAIELPLGQDLAVRLHSSLVRATSESRQE